jgi:hypothetical protein
LSKSLLNRALRARFYLFHVPLANLKLAASSTLQLAAKTFGLPAASRCKSASVSAIQRPTHRIAFDPDNGALVINRLQALHTTRKLTIVYVTQLYVDV